MARTRSGTFCRGEGFHRSGVGTRFGIEKVLDALVMAVVRINKVVDLRSESHGIHTNRDCRNRLLLLLITINVVDIIGGEASSKM